MSEFLAAVVPVAVIAIIVLAGLVALAWPAQHLTLPRVGLALVCIVGAVFATLLGAFLAALAFVAVLFAIAALTDELSKPRGGGSGVWTFSSGGVAPVENSARSPREEPVGASAATADEIPYPSPPPSPAAAASSSRVDGIGVVHPFPANGSTVSHTFPPRPTQIDAGRRWA